MGATAGRAYGGAGHPRIEIRRRTVKTATWPRWEPVEAAGSLTSRCLNVAILQGGSRLQVEGCSPSCHSQITATTHASFITGRSHARCIAVSRFLIYNWQKYEFNFFSYQKEKEYGFSHPHYCICAAVHTLFL